jgi:hypothetical protein
MTPAEAKDNGFAETVIDPDETADLAATQGGWARVAIHDSFDVCRLQHQQPGCSCESATVDGRSVPKLSMYHPRYGGFHQEKERIFPCFCLAVAERFGDAKGAAS